MGETTATWITAIAAIALVPLGIAQWRASRVKLQVRATRQPFHLPDAYSEILKYGDYALQRRAVGEFSSQSLPPTCSHLLDRFADAGEVGLGAPQARIELYWECDVENRGHEMVSQAQLRLPGAVVSNLTARGTTSTRHGENLSLPDLSPGEVIHLSIWSKDRYGDSELTVLLTKGKATVEIMRPAPPFVVKLWSQWKFFRPMVVFTLATAGVISALVWLFGSK
jgi:hypothetical protein